MDVDPLPSSSRNSTSPPFPSSGESLTTSNWKSKRNKKRKSKSKKSPTYSSHVGGNHLAYASHVGGKSTVTASHTGNNSPTYAIHGGDATILYESC